MAYGNSRRRREQEPEIRDVVEEAARDAGLSIDEFLDQALAAQEDDRRRDASRRHLRLVERDESPLTALERRLSGAGRAADPMPEDKVATILERAFDEIRASEQRTATILDSIARTLPGQNRQPPQSVADIMASAERRARNPANIVELGGARNASGIVDRIEDGLSRQEVEKALHLLERKLALIAPQSDNDRLVLNGMGAEIASIRALVLAEGAHVPLAAIEKPVQSLTERIGALASRPAPQQPASLQVLDRRLDEVSTATASMVAGIQDELVRLGRSGLNRNDNAVQASFDRLDQRIVQLEQTARLPLDTIRNQLDALHETSVHRSDGDSLRASIASLERKLDQLSGRIAQPLHMVHNAVTQLAGQKSSAQADGGRLDQLFGELAALKRGIAEQSAGFAPAVMQRQLVAISNRIEGIAHRLQQGEQGAEPRDPRRKSIDEEILEIKELISEAKSPCDDTRVLDAIAQLERKIAALENSPQALMERLDRMQARLDERPAGGGGALPANIEILLRNLAMRLESPVAAGGMDDAGLDRLHQEIRSLSHKLEAMPQTSGFAPQMQDLTGVERSISDLFQQIDHLKVEIGDRAARAAAEAVRGIQATAIGASSFTPVSADTSHIEATLGQMRQSQVDAEMRTSRTLEALHETLERVVDRLSTMERDVRTPGMAHVAAVAPAAPPMPAPVVPPAMTPPAAPPPAPAAPRADYELDLLPPDILPPKSEAPAARQRPTATMPAAEAGGARSFAETLA
ncbi:MAG: hypothetical protein ACRCTI_15340, partial [Beijerinckiaceae bacterium]